MAEFAPPNQDVVGIKVEAAFFVDPSHVTPELLNRIQDIADSLGPLAIADAAFNAKLSIVAERQLTPKGYAQELLGVEAETRRFAEMAQAGSVLDTSTRDLARIRHNPIPRAMLGHVEKLEECGLDTARSLLAIGHDILFFGTAAGADGDTIDRITKNLEARGLTLSPFAPDVAQVALICDTLDQVPGYALLQFTTPADRYASQLETLGIKGWRSDEGFIQNVTRDAWRDSGLLNMRISELTTLAVAGLAEKIPEDTAIRAGLAPLDCAQKLHDAIHAYAQKFSEAKNNN